MEMARSSSSDTDDDSDSTGQEEEEEEENDAIEGARRGVGREMEAGDAGQQQVSRVAAAARVGEEQTIGNMTGSRASSASRGSSQEPPAKKRRGADHDGGGGGEESVGGNGSSSSLVQQHKNIPEQKPGKEKERKDGGEERLFPVDENLMEEPTSSAVTAPTVHSPMLLSSSSSTNRSEEDQKIIDGLMHRLHESTSQMSALTRDLRESVECPVCFSVPRTPPVPCCRNGHVICSRCKSKCDACPKCRSSKIDCVSQVAVTIIQRISHPCDFRDEGCTFRGHVTSISSHEENCRFRLVRCPHWACDEMITARNLTHHVIAAECGDSYRDKPLPYQEEMVYTQALDDEEGNGFWKPSLLEFNGITFYLQVEKCGKSRNWYFYIQMEGSPRDCEKYGTTIKVSKKLKSDRNAIVYNGGVCPIDIKGAAEVEASGVGLNIRDSAMERIFDMERDQSGGNSGDNGGGGQQHQRGDDEQMSKFWVDVDIFRVEDA